MLASQIKNGLDSSFPMNAEQTQPAYTKNMVPIKFTTNPNENKTKGRDTEWSVPWFAITTWICFSSSLS